MSDKIAESIARKLGKEGIEYLEKNGDLPVIKLSPEEMEFVRGGINVVDSVKDAWRKLKDFWPQL